MATRVGLAEDWMTKWNMLTPKPRLVQEYGTYLKYEPSYGKFGVKISKFSLPWQQGLVWLKSHLVAALHSLIGINACPKC